MARTKLDPRVFANEYVKDFDATAAFTRAYGPRKTVGGTRLSAHKMLHSKAGAQAVAELTRARVERIGFDADRVLEEIARLAFSDINNLFEEDGETFRAWKDIDPMFKKAISSVEVHLDKNSKTVKIHKIKMWDKLGALEKLGKHLRLFHDTKLEVSDADGGPLSGNEMSPIELARKVAFILNEGVRKKGKAGGK